MKILVAILFVLYLTSSEARKVCKAKRFQKKGACQRAGDGCFEMETDALYNENHDSLADYHKMEECK